MGTIFAVEYRTLDGVFDEPGQWSGPWFNEELQQCQADNLAACDGRLLGRVGTRASPRRGRRWRR